jgi:ribosomal protein S27AE
MPVLTLACPRCGHEAHSLMMAGTRPPEIWVCGKCGSQEVAPKADAPEQEHPWESAGKSHHGGCPCCGL